MTTNFRDAQLGPLVDLYNDWAPDLYKIDEDLLRLKTIESPIFDWGASCIEVDSAFIAVKKPANYLYSGPDQDTAYITLLAFQDPKKMLDLVSETKSCLRNRGISRLTFGTDSGHIFPGCPTQFTQLSDFLMIGGFSEGGLANDLERDLQTYECPVAIPAGDEYRPVVEADLVNLSDFFDREFPGRWKYDVFQKIKAEEDPTTVFGLFVDGRCEGFALLQKDGCNRPIGGAVWRVSLGPNWGSLGPIGISKHVRGKGSGHALLGKALEHLRDQRVERCIIDWTGLVDFYGRHGFEVTRSYRMMSLNL